MDNGSATVTANLSADYGAGNGITLVELNVNSKCNLRQTPSRNETSKGLHDVDVTAKLNTHVTSPVLVDTHSKLMIIEK